MDLKIGKKITALRKERGMTQEQLATALGVSSPAVSKWETDNSYPDITLICALARALGTDVNELLSYEEFLSEERVRNINQEIMGIIFQGKFDQAEEMITNLLKEYPSDVPLKFSAISIYQMILSMNPSATEADINLWNNKRAELAKSIYDSGNTTYHRAATSILISIAIEEKNVEKAQLLLNEMIAEAPDAVDLTSQRVSLYLLKDEKDEATSFLNNQLDVSIGQLMNTMMVMLRDDLEVSKDKVIEICEKMQSLEKLFNYDGTLYYAVYLESYLRVGEYEKALEYLESFAKSASQEMRLILFQALSTEKMFDPIRSDTRFIKICESLMIQ